MDNNSHNIFFTFLIYFALSFPTVIKANAELRALMELKSSLDPENKFLKSWTFEGDPCSSFQGVACNQHLKVANITLQGKGLTGKLSPAVAGLKCLSGLYLHYNFLSGEIPREIFGLTELVDLYLNVNNFSGIIPPEIGKMASLQVLDLCCNQMNGSIPKEIGNLKKLSAITLQHNRLTGPIPSSVGNLEMLKRLDLSFNQLSGNIPFTLANPPELKILDLQNNTLAGVVPPALKKLNGGFKGENNLGLCGVGFSSLRVCSTLDNSNINKEEPFAPRINSSATKNVPTNAKIPVACSQTNCSTSSKLPRVAIITGVIICSITLMVGAFLFVFQLRRRKQKIGFIADSTSDDRLSTNEAKDLTSRSASPLITLEYSNKWDPMMSYQIGSEDSDNFLHRFNFNLEEIESATQYFSEFNLLGKSKFSAVYKGILKDGSLVAIKCVHVINCKSEETEFMNGLRLLTSLRHENLAKLRGFCCSMSRGECYLIYDFALNGNLSRYLDVVDGGDDNLDWTTKVSIIKGIAKGIGYLHRSETNRPAIVHQNISVKKVLLDEQFKPIIMDSGLQKLLVDDIIFSTLKVSASLGYMAPEYITTGGCTEKSDVYAFGVIILQILSGKTYVSSSMRLAAESCRYEEFIDANMKGKFSKTEAANLTKIAVICRDENPDCRPTMKTVIQDLSNLVS